LLGRDNDLVNIAGKRTSIGHLDHLLNAIAGVRDGAFVDPGEVSDKADRPQRLIAFFVSDTLDERAVLAALREMTDAVFLPRPLYRVAALPRSPTGKLPRVALLELAAACREQ
jgi:acyl-coenzyme A synthetase/AMP-(fatty) acid ligase